MRWLDRIFGGSNDMAALAAGTKAPDFTLSSTDGKRFSLVELLSQGPVLAAFFKVSCPVCQYAFPFFQRLHKAYPKMTIVGVSQDNALDTAAFMKEFGVTFPVLLDNPATYAVSNAYGLTNVPSAFWINSDSTVDLSSVGWVRADMEEMSRKMAESLETSRQLLFRPGEDIRDFRAG